MKNIFLLPSNEPSYLYKMSDGILRISDLFESGNSAWKNQNIYITNSEEIKEGDFFIMNSCIVRQCKERTSTIITDTIDGEHSCFVCKKIVVCTDTELIKNGVQELDETFLNWFVSKANDSGKPIDIVEVRKESRCCGLCNGIDDLCFSDRYCEEHNELGCEKCFGTRVNYKPIIPTQEQKQETIEEVAERIKNESMMCCNLSKQIDYVTVAEREKSAFIKGAEWQKHQSEKMFSESDNFALNFVKWIQINCTDIEISDKGQIHYFYNDKLFKTPEELLEIYKHKKH